MATLCVRLLVCIVLPNAFSISANNTNSVTSSERINPFKKSLYLQDVVDRVNKDPNMHWTAETIHSLKDQESLPLSLDNVSSVNNFVISKKQATYSQGIDWRRSNRLVQPEYQGQCGSCWAFSAMHALADRLALQGNPYFTAYPNPGLSTQHVIECCNGMYCSGCNGASDNAAGLHFVQRNYAVFTSCKPYEGESQYCRVACTNNGDTNAVRLHNYRRLNSDPEEIRMALQEGPVTAAMKVYADLYTYRAGIYEHSKSNGGSYISLHSVEIVGYGTEHGKDYWIVKNSWGPVWGEGGYFRMIAGKNHLGIESEVIAPVLTAKSFVQTTDAPLISSVGSTNTAGRDEKDIQEVAKFVAHELPLFCQDGRLDSPQLEQPKVGEHYSVENVLEASKQGVQGVEYNILVQLRAPRCTVPSFVQATVLMTNGEYMLVGHKYISYDNSVSFGGGCMPQSGTVFILLFAMLASFTVVNYCYQ